jgi:hypothetical protein
MQRLSPRFWDSEFGGHGSQGFVFVVVHLTDDGNLSLKLLVDLGGSKRNPVGPFGGPARVKDGGRLPSR